MKILFEHPVPAGLAHGGMQTQIDQTKAALETLGVEVEYLRWWDEGQSGDVIHFFGRMSPELILFAQRKGIRVVLSVLLAAQGARPGWKLWLQRQTIRLMRAALPAGLTAAYRWDAGGPGGGNAARTDRTRRKACLRPREASGPGGRLRPVPPCVCVP